MKINEFIKSIKDKTNLDELDPLIISKRIPHYYSMVLNEIYKHTEILISIESEYSVLYSNILKDFYKGDLYNFTPKTKDHTESLLSGHEKLVAITEKMNRIKKIIEALEKQLKYFSDLQFNIKNIIELEKIKRGII